MMTRESYSTRSRSTSVGTLWYGFRSRRSSGNLPGSTLTMSMLMPFSASTMRVRWLHGSLGAEKSVMMDRLLDKFPLPQYQRRRTLRRHRPTRPRPSMDVFPVFLLQQHREPRERDEEEHHPYAEGSPLRLVRLADVVEEVHGITNERIVVGLGQTTRDDHLEFLEFPLRDRFSVLALLLHVPEDGLLDAFELRKGVGHGRSGQPEVIHAR